MTACPKPKTYRSKAWLAAVRSISECKVCFSTVAVEAAHINMGKGMGMKTHDCWTAAICHECHVQLDQGKTYTRDERRAILDRAVLLTLAELALNGKVAPT